MAIREGDGDMKKIITLLILALSLAGAVTRIKADIVVWNYEDDFSTAKAKTDSYDHTPFQPMDAFHPLPALCYWPGEEALLFEGENNGQNPAFLSYAFPLENVMTQVDSATLDVEVFFASGGTYTPYLNYQLSNNGVDWSELFSFTGGQNQISLLPSENPYTYIKFLGSDAWIDNLSVAISGPEAPEPTTITLFGLGMAGIILSRKRKR